MLPPTSYDAIELCLPQTHLKKSSFVIYRESRVGKIQACSGVVLHSPLRIETQIDFHRTKHHAITTPLAAIFNEENCTRSDKILLKPKNLGCLRTSQKFLYFRLGQQHFPRWSYSVL